MPYPAPDPRNFTRPGGIALYVDAGNGFEHLGNIDITKMTAEAKNDELEIESQLSGEARTAEILIIKRSETYKFPLQEITHENLQRYFCGGDIIPVDPGSAAVVDQKLTLSGALLASLGQYGLSAVTVRQFFDYVFRKEADGSFTDLSVEADTIGGTPFDFITDPDQEFYFLKNTPFKEFYSDLAVNGDYAGLTVKYWNGSWTAVADLGGTGKDFDADGKINFTQPSDQVKKLINGVMAYALQVKVTGITIAATINCFRQNAVQNTDYILDPGQASGTLLAGRVGRLSGGFLADGEEVKVSYTYTTWESLTFPVAMAQYARLAARIDYLTTKGTQMRRHIPACHIKPDGAISFDSKKELQIPVSLQVLDDYANNPTMPYGWKEVL